jgi:hypothetical protein
VDPPTGRTRPGRPQLRAPPPIVPDKQRLEKVLEDAGVKLSTVAVDVLGPPGGAMPGTGVAVRGDGDVGAPAPTTVRGGALHVERIMRERGWRGGHPGQEGAHHGGRPGRRTWSSVASPSKARMPCGWPISPGADA